MVERILSERAHREMNDEELSSLREMCLESVRVGIFDWCDVSSDRELSVNDCLLKRIAEHVCHTVPIASVNSVLLTFDNSALCSEVEFPEGDEFRSELISTTKGVVDKLIKISLESAERTEFQVKVLREIWLPSHRDSLHKVAVNQLRGRGIDPRDLQGGADVVMSELWQSFSKRIHKYNPNHKSRWYRKDEQQIQLRIERHFFCYIGGVIKNICKGDHSQSEQRRKKWQPYKDGMSKETVAPVIDEIIVKEASDVLSKMLAAAMEQLSESDQELLKWIYIEGLTNTDVVQRLEIREAAARQRVSRARSRLRRILEREYKISFRED